MAEINHRVGIKGSLDAVYGAIGTVEGLKEWWTADTSGSSEVGETIADRRNSCLESRAKIFDGSGETVLRRGQKQFALEIQRLTIPKNDRVGSWDT